jgi:sortase A
VVSRLHQGAEPPTKPVDVRLVALRTVTALRLSHRTARVVGGIGRALIGLGLITLLFVAYQLWGTGLQQARAQDQLGNDFATRLAETEDARNTTTTAPTPTTVPLPERAIGSSRPIDIPGVTTTTTEPSEPDPEPLDPELLAALAPALGEPVAQMRIPSIGVDETIVYGVRVPDLRKGPGVFPSNPMPGASGNAAVAGHRTTYGQPFHDLDLIQPGDEIIVNTLRGEFTYVVMGHLNEAGEEWGHFIVPETGIEVLDDYGDNRITLVACHPKYSSRQRIIVSALLVEDPVEPPPAPEPVEDLDDAAPPPTTIPEPVPAENWGEGLDGDSSALVPTLLWGGMFLLALFVASGIGRLWKRWPVYVLSSPVLVWLLWSCFVHLDQLLPSY